MLKLNPIYFNPIRKNLFSQPKIHPTSKKNLRGKTISFIVKSPPHFSTKKTNQNSFYLNIAKDLRTIFPMLFFHRLHTRKIHNVLNKDLIFCLCGKFSHWFTSSFCHYFPVFCVCNFNCANYIYIHKRICYNELLI